MPPPANQNAHCCTDFVRVICESFKKTTKNRVFAKLSARRHQSTRGFITAVSAHPHPPWLPPQAPPGAFGYLQERKHSFLPTVFFISFRLHPSCGVRFWWCGIAPEYIGNPNCLPWSRQTSFPDHRSVFGLSNNEINKKTLHLQLFACLPPKTLFRDFCAPHAFTSVHSIAVMAALLVRPSDNQIRPR